MQTPFYYRGYGLLFSSEIELPELTPARPGPTDVSVTLGQQAAEALATLQDPAKAEFEFTRTPLGHVINLPDHAALLVPARDSVIVDLRDGCDLGLVRLFLIGSVIGILFHLRGQLVMHGAAIVHDERVSIFVGQSGAGKSTLAAHMGTRGFSILSDDTLPLSRQADGQFVGWPGSRVFKLWRDALDALGRDVQDLNAVQFRTDKFFTPNAAVARDAPHPVTEVIVLERDDDITRPRLDRLSDLEALQQINEHAYRPEYVELLGRETPHFQVTAALAGTVRTYRLTRPWDLGRMEETVDLMLDHWVGLKAAP